MRSLVLHPVRHRRGGVLISVLVFTVIIAFLIAGIGALTVSHYSRVHVEADYTTALDVAEAGINYELRNISVNLYSNSNQIDQYHPGAGQNGAYTGSIPGVPGTFTVYVINDPDDGKSWSSPNSALIVSTGTVNGVSRTVQIRGEGRSVFGQYALFGIDSTTLNGNFTVNGDFGTDSAMTIHGSSGTINGTVYFNGVAGGSISGSTATGGYVDEPNTVVWPTVSAMADHFATLEASKLGMATPTSGGGLTWFKNTYNDNSNIQMLASGDAALTDPTQHVWQPAGFTADANGNWTLGDKGGISTFSALGVTTNSNIMDAATASPARYVFPTTAWPNNAGTTAAYGLQGCQALILPGSPDPAVPYNYYFDEIALSNAQTSAILVDTATGPVNIWIGPSTSYGASSDSLNGTWLFTSSDTTRCRVYYGKNATLNIGGNSVFSGSIYAYNGPTSGTIKFHGTPVINGSVIADNFNIMGNPLINFPNNAGAGTDYGLFYGFKNQYTEINGM